MQGGERAMTRLDDAPGQPPERGSQRAFLEELFVRLRAADVAYAVLRNYEALPDGTDGSDIDLLVAERSRDATWAAIGDAARAAGGVLLGFTESPSSFKVCALGRTDAAAWWGVPLDVNVALQHKDARYGVLEDLSHAAGEHRGVKVIAPGVAAVLGVVKELLNHGSVPDRYRDAADAAFREDPAGVADALRRFGNAGLSVLRAAVHGDSPGQDPARSARTLRRTLFFRALRERPIAYLRARVAHEWSKVRRWLSPPGYVVAFMGVDGVGKSTVIRDVEPALSAATHRNVRTSHLRPRLLPPLARLKGVPAPTIAVLDPHGSTPSGVLGSLLRLAYYATDYLVGYWLRVRPFVARRPSVWLFDRYAYDMAVDPRRFRIGVSARVASLFTRCVPRPDVIVCLHASAEVIAGRKQELPRAEVERQLRALRDFAGSEPRAVLVSTEGTREEVRDRVLEALCGVFRRRTERQRTPGSRAGGRAHA